VSMSLQYGVPLEVYVKKFSHTRFEPWGYTKNPDIPVAKSLVDYIFRWMGTEFIPGYREASRSVATESESGGRESASGDDTETERKPAATRASGLTEGHGAAEAGAKGSVRGKPVHPGRGPATAEPNGHGPHASGVSNGAAAGSRPAAVGQASAKPANGLATNGSHAKAASQPKGQSAGVVLAVQSVSTTTAATAVLLERAGLRMAEHPAASAADRASQFATFQIDAPACDSCGSITVRNGNCYLCHNCGNSMGCS